MSRVALNWGGAPGGTNKFTENPVYRKKIVYRKLLLRFSTTLPLPLVSLHHATAPPCHLATAAFTSFGTTSPRYIKQHAMYLPWRGSHLAIMEDGSKALLVISATESCSWYAFSAEITGAFNVK
ncbi:hypothetical protein JHK85_057811 [Glycine max]|uniref:Uncharacterized protein n=1 Tax=Glycine max TaxID=3847 RepID=K7N4P2_SOYBN|nr:hypothetical protein JHK85_057811 [Glycine max]KAH1037090.1 hypothetical protein GYH30_056477 [Glycine max]